MKFLTIIGIGLYWLAWPAYQVYLRLSERTRVVLVHDGKVLVMHQWISTGQWSLPGGGMHKGETSLNGAVRELHEETGITADPAALIYLGREAYRAHGHHFMYHVYAAPTQAREPLHRQWYEVADLAWVSPAALNAHNTAADTLRSVRLVQEHTRLLQ